METELIIRSITFFTKRISDTIGLENEYNKATSVLDRVARELVYHGYNVFTKRISFPGLSRELINRLLEHVGKDILVSIGYSRISRKEIVEFAYNGLYIPVLHDTEPNMNDAREYSKIFHEAASRDPVAATRIAIGFHGRDFITPYFPDSSSSGENSIGLAFIYPKLLVNKVKANIDIHSAFKEVYAEMYKVFEITKNISGLPVYIDYSLSPWMDNSVAELYEISGFPILEPGSLYYTWILNNVINASSQNNIRVGFNKVMLPYAEDSLLIKMGEEKKLRARDFILYASTCVAGVDMIVVPEDTEKLAQLIASTMALARVKNEPVSLRSIPVPGKPGDIVDLKRFGKIPIINY